MKFKLSRFLAPSAVGAPSVFLLAACLGDPADLRPVEAPRFAYDSVLTFTVGALEERAVVSSGGQAFTWSVSPALPSGLSLGATGAIAGLPSEADTGKVYVVTAKGPGGSGRDTVRIRVLPETIDPAVAPPRISMASPARDTVGKAAAHAVTSTGGPVTGYAVSPTLPPGLTLNLATGAVSGTPTAAWGREAYAIIAFGPGGRDTATLDLSVHARGDAELPRLAVEVRFHGANGALPSMALKRMILTVASNLGDTLRDTVNAGAQGLARKIDTTRVFSKEYLLPKTLREWKVHARVFDLRDSLVFADSGAPVAGTGLARDTLDLVSRYVAFRATYAFPDSVRSASTSRAWPVTLKRFTLQAGAATLIDTSASAGFKQSLSVEYSYLAPGRSHALTHAFRGSVAGRADTVLFQASGSYTPTVEPSNIMLVYVGPTDLQ